MALVACSGDKSGSGPSSSGPSLSPITPTTPTTPTSQQLENSEADPEIKRDAPIAIVVPPASPQAFTPATNIEAPVPHRAYWKISDEQWQILTNDIYLRASIHNPHAIRYALCDFQRNRFVLDLSKGQMVREEPMAVPILANGSVIAQASSVTKTKSADEKKLRMTVSGITGKNFPNQFYVDYTSYSNYGMWAGNSGGCDFSSSSNLSSLSENDTVFYNRLAKVLNDLTLGDCRLTKVEKSYEYQTIQSSVVSQCSLSQGIILQPKESYYFTVTYRYGQPYLEFRRTTRDSDFSIVRTIAEHDRLNSPSTTQFNYLDKTVNLKHFNNLPDGGFAITSTDRNGYAKTVAYNSNGQLKSEVSHDLGEYPPVAVGYKLLIWQSKSMQYSYSYLTLVDLSSQTQKQFSVQYKITSATLLASGIIAYTTESDLIRGTQRLHFFDPRTDKGREIQKIDLGQVTSFHSIKQMTNKNIMIDNSYGISIFNETGNRLRVIQADCSRDRCSEVQNSNAIIIAPDNEPVLTTVNIQSGATQKIVLNGINYILSALEVEGRNLLIVSKYGDIRLITPKGETLEQKSTAHSFNRGAIKLADGLALLISPTGQFYYFAANGRFQSCRDLESLSQRPRDFWDAFRMGPNYSNGLVNLISNDLTLLINGNDIYATTRGPFHAVANDSIVMGRAGSGYNESPRTVAIGPRSFISQSLYEVRAKDCK